MEKEENIEKNNEVAVSNEEVISYILSHENKDTNKPTEGVDLGEGFRKVRMAIASKNRGKSHGARVITYLYAINEVEGNISLLSIYDKQEKDNISEAELRQLKAEIKAKVGITSNPVD